MMGLGAGSGLLTGGGGDDRDELQFGDGGSGDVDSLGVGPDVGRNEEEAGVFEHVVEQCGIERGETLELFGFGGRSGGLAAKGEAQPEALGAGTRKEGPAREALRIGRVVQVEVADVADVLDLSERDGGDAARKVKQVDNPIPVGGARANEA